MFDAAYYRQKAEVCRRVAGESKWSEPYLLELADSFDLAAKSVELKLSGSKPSKASGSRKAPPLPAGRG
jgi:hypothetical protein